MGNIWVPVVINYINNNMVAVLTQSADFGNQVEGCFDSADSQWNRVYAIFVYKGI